MFLTIVSVLSDMYSSSPTCVRNVVDFYCQAIFCCYIVLYIFTLLAKRGIAWMGATLLPGIANLLEAGKKFIMWLVRVNSLAAWCGCLYVLSFVSEIAREEYKMYLAMFTRMFIFVHHLNMTGLRHSFLRFDWRKVPGHSLQQHHTHPKLASYRNAAGLLMNHFCDRVQKTRFDLSSNRSRDKTLGTHDYYFIKDTARIRWYDKMPKNRLVTMMDVDYYLDTIPQKLLGCPLLLYTVCPSKLADESKERTYRFINKDTLEMIIQGGERYTHKIYDYDRSVISLPTWFGYWNYYVDRVKQHEEKFFVLMTPFSWVFDPFHLLKITTRATTPVDQRGSWLHMVMQHHNGLFRHIKSVDGFLDAILPQADWESLLALWPSCPNKNIGQVQRYFKDSTARDTIRFASVIYRALCEYNGENPVVQTYPARFVVDVIDDKRVMDEGKDHGQDLLDQPITTSPSMTVNASKASDKYTVTERVEKVRNDVEPPLVYNEYAKEFITQLVGDKRGHPVPYSEVIENQNRPVQMQRINQYVYPKITHDVEVGAFQKMETIPLKIGPARNISAVNIEHNLALSSFTYPFKNAVLRDLDWYSPCKPPLELSESVHQYALRHKSLLSSDFSKFDGTISRWLRSNVERAAYELYFDQWAELVSKLCMAECTASAKTRFGVRYRPENSRLSGSPLTTDGNTMINAFVAFAALRKVGCSPAEAFRDIGPKAGDDSIVTAKVKNSLLEVCKDLGLDVKVEIINKNKPVPYLGRYWVNPWVTLTSMQDLTRTLPKLSAVGSKQHAPAQALANKCKGYYVTDAHTPILGSVLRNIARKHGFKLTDAPEFNRIIGTDRELIRKFNDGPFPNSEADHPELVWLAARLLKIEPTDVLNIEWDLDNDTAQFPILSTDVKLAETLSAVVNGWVVAPPKRQNTTSTSADECKQKRKGPKRPVQKRWRPKRRLRAATPQQ